jgi:hypothetical protein
MTLAPHQNQAGREILAQNQIPVVFRTGAEHSVDKLAKQIS